MFNSKFWVKKSLHPEKQGVAWVLQNGKSGQAARGLARWLSHHAWAGIAQAACKGNEYGWVWLHAWHYGSHNRCH